MTRLFVFVFAPGFILYHVAVGQQLIAPYLGGYLSAASFLLLPFALWKLLTSNPKPTSEVFFIAFLVIFLSIVLWNIVQPSADPKPTIYQSHLLVIVQWLVTFYLGRSISFDRTDHGVFVGSFALLIAVMAYFTDTSARFNPITPQAQAALAGTSLADYQSYAMMFLIVALLATAPSPSIVKRSILYVLTLAGLFVIQARAELVAFPLSIATIEFCYAKPRIKPLLAGAAAAPFLIFILIPLLVEMFPNSRFALFWNAGLNDQSATERSVFTQLAIQTIKRNLWLGDYASYEPGQYAHNALSAWIDLGYLGFGFYLLLLLVPILCLAIDLPHHGRRPAFVTAAAFLIIATPLTLFLKAFVYQLIPFALGLYAGYRTSVTEPFQVSLDCGECDTRFERRSGSLRNSGDRQG